ncbi:MAG: enoyl-CoA hydratase/isomerase family protein [Dehalococcoidales bacterium]|nr:enoyl-CoA hydratase/isomerase family protein [Dehalococcoidales bacterium]
MPYKTIVYSKKSHVAHVTLNRPDAGNTVNQQLAQELEEVCNRINQDDDVYVVTLTGAGDTFCSGGEVESEDAPCRPAASIASIDRPVIAAINGDALEEGLEIALSCDIRLASDKARFGLPQVVRGRIPMDGGTQRLPRIVGRGKALELLLTGDIMSADEALEIGLVSQVVPPEALAEETGKLAETVAAKGPIALRYLKEAVNKGLDMTLEQGLRLEADLYFLLHTTADRTEGIQAFLKKRPPKFKGE